MATSSGDPGASSSSVKEGAGNLQRALTIIRGAPFVNVLTLCSTMGISAQIIDLARRLRRMPKEEKDEELWADDGGSFSTGDSFLPRKATKLEQEHMKEKEKNLSLFQGIQEELSDAHIDRALAVQTLVEAEDETATVKTPWECIHFWGARIKLMACVTMEIWIHYIDAYDALHDEFMENNAEKHKDMSPQEKIFEFVRYYDLESPPFAYEYVKDIRSIVGLVRQFPRLRFLTNPTRLKHKVKEFEYFVKNGEGAASRTIFWRELPKAPEKITISLPKTDFSINMKPWDPKSPTDEIQRDFWIGLSEDDLWSERRYVHWLNKFYEDVLAGLTVIQDDVDGVASSSSSHLDAPFKIVGGSIASDRQISASVPVSETASVAGEIEHMQISVPGVEGGTKPPFKGKKKRAAVKRP
jgi:hypothetical protein